MQWKTVHFNIVRRIAVLLLAFTTAWTFASSGRTEDVRHAKTSAAAGSSASGGTSTQDVAPAKETSDTSASSRRGLGNPAAATSTPSGAKNSSAENDGAFAEDESKSGDYKSADSGGSTSLFATTFDDPPPRPAASVQSASFGGVQPEVTTAEQLADKWGPGQEVSHKDNQTVLRFSRPSFPQVDVTLVDGVARSIVINLDQSIPTDTLARELQLDDVRPVDVPDDSGELLGQAFPERGVLFSITPDGKRVSQVLLDKIDQSSFLLRAEIDLQRHTHSSLADIDYVLSEQPKNARALWLRARVMCALARYDEAMHDVDAALEVEKEPLYRLTRGEILGQKWHYDDAIKETKDVLAIGDLVRNVRAKALCQLGDLLAACPVHDYKGAMEDHLAAIKLADPLSIDKHLAVRRAAKLLLVDAHLAVANDIAYGVWQQKEKVVPKWLERARAYAEDSIAHEDADPALRLHLAQGALAACAGAEGKIDSVPWARMALQAGKPLIFAADDPWTKLALQWDLGVALSDGLLSDELRGAVQHAMSNTALTITYMETGAKGRRETPTDVFRMGWLYYRMGALHAVQHNDHKTAVAWYEKAFPLLDRPIPPALRNQQGRYGEWLVSMGISYWEEANRSFALQVTDAGAQHVKEAIHRKLMDESALAIPYGNLAFMHEALGHNDEAQNFAKLAAKYEVGDTSKH
jgi:tetratricopeptide (TPR) repeat protein